MQKKIIIADDHLLTLMGLRASLSSDTTLNIVGEAQNVEGLFQILSERACDLVITDLMMPSSKQPDGIKLIEQLRRHYPQMSVIVVTMLTNPAFVVPMLRLGVQGVISKCGLQHDLHRAIRATAAAPYISPSFGDIHAPQLSVLKTKQLSFREIEVLRLFGTGLSVCKIAAKTNRSKQTISNQKISAMRKLGMTSNADLYQFIQQAGLTPPSL